MKVGHVPPVYNSLASNTNPNFQPPWMMLGDWLTGGTPPPGSPPFQLPLPTDSSSLAAMSQFFNEFVTGLGNTTWAKANTASFQNINNALAAFTKTPSADTAKSFGQALLSNPPALNVAADATAGNYSECYATPMENALRDMQGCVMDSVNSGSLSQDQYEHLTVASQLIRFFANGCDTASSPCSLYQDRSPNIIGPLNDITDLQHGGSNFKAFMVAMSTVKSWPHTLSKNELNLADLGITDLGSQLAGLAISGANFEPNNFSPNI